MENEKEDSQREIEEIVKQVEPELLDRVPVKKRTQVLRAASRAAMVMVARHIYFSGPLPPADMLADYDKLIPNGAERLMKMVEAQSSHRQTIEASVIAAQLKESGRGQSYAFITTVLLIAAGIWAFLHDCPSVSGIIFTATISTVAGIFIYGKHQQKASLQEKKPPAQSKE